MKALAVFLVLNAFSSTENIKKLAGCFVVDYSYSEIKSLNPDYVLDSRVYDSSDKFVVKELIKLVSESPLRLQHFLVAEDFSGKLLFKMRHHGEIWRKSPETFMNYIGRFESEDRWQETPLEKDVTWLREITSLDDGPRYNCRGNWSTERNYPSFTCQGYSPIPGRETRDMGRKDYNTLERTSKIQIYKESWLEKQKNTKIIFDNGEKTQLAKEVGKHWYVRQKESECSGIKKWVNKNTPYWNILAEAWKDIFQGDYNENPKLNNSSRYGKIQKAIKHFQKEGIVDTQTIKSKFIEIIKEHQL